MKNENKNTYRNIIITSIITALLITSGIGVAYAANFPGSNTFGGGGTTASGPNSAAFGWATTSSGGDSIAFGKNTIASGGNSAAFGWSTSLAAIDLLPLVV